MSKEKFKNKRKDKNRVSRFFLGLIIASSFVLWAFQLKVYPIESDFETQILEDPNVYVSLQSYVVPEKVVEKKPKSIKKEISPIITIKRMVLSTKPSRKKEAISSFKIPEINPSGQLKGMTPVNIETEIIASPDEKASFPGGKDKLMEFLQDNLNYPKIAQMMEAEGRVIVEFMVDEEGNVTNIRVVRDYVKFGASEESIRVVKLMPKWKPGIKDGKAVKTIYFQTFRYKLSF